MSLDKFYTPDSSFFEIDKYEKLATKQQEKAFRLLDITPPPSRLQDDIDMLQASALNSAGLFSDLSKNAANYLLGTSFDSSQETGFSNQELADSAAGVRPEARQQLNNVTSQIGEDVDQGNYLEAALKAASNADRYLVDSGGSFIEALAPVVAAPFTGGLSLALGGMSKLKKVKDTYNAFNKVKDVNKLRQAANFVGRTAKQSSVLTANQTQRIVHDYQAEHDGELPSEGRVAAIALGSLATQTTDLGIMKKLFLPGTKVMNAETKKLVSSVGFDKSSIAEIAKRVGRGAKAIATAGGAEAVQEYIQTWHEILSVKVDPKTGQSLSDAVIQEINNPDNRSQAAVGGIIGGAAGGAARGTFTLPSVAAGTAVDTLTGTLKTAKAGIDGISNKVARSNLSDTDKRDLNVEYKNQKNLVEKSVAELERQNKVIAKAKDLEALKSDPEIAKIVEKLQNSGEEAYSDKNLSNPREFNALKSMMVKKNRQASETVRKSLKRAKLSHFSNKSSTPRGVDLKAPEREAVQTLAEKVAPHGKEFVDAVNSLETHLAVNTVNAFNEDVTEVSKRGIRQAENLSLEDVKKVAAIISKTNPAAAARLAKIAKKKEAALNRFTPSRSKILTEKTIPKEFKEVADIGIVDEQAVPVISAFLSSAMGKKVAGKDTLETVARILEHYENTEAYKNQEKGTVRKDTVARWKIRLKNKRKAFEAKEQAAEEKAEKPSKKEPKESSKKKSEKVSEEERPSEGKHKKLSKNLQTFVEYLNAYAAQNNDTSTDSVVDLVPDLVNKLITKDYTTVEDFENLLTGFPELKKNKKVYNAFQLALEDNNIREEEDIVEVTPMSDADIDAQYKKDHPGC